jgi:hypothetical protein
MSHQPWSKSARWKLHISVSFISLFGVAALICSTLQLASAETVGPKQTFLVIYVARRVDRVVRRSASAP